MITGNEPANPQIETNYDFADQMREKVYGNTYSNGGLTIRQHFAAMAMQGLCANSEWGKTIKSDDWDDFIKRATSGSVEIADALIAELNKEVKP